MTSTRRDAQCQQMGLHKAFLSMSDYLAVLCNGTCTQSTIGTGETLRNHHVLCDRCVMIVLGGQQPLPFRGTTR